MAYSAPPAKTAISDTYPNPSNATARTGFGVLWDYATGLLGSTGNPAAAQAALQINNPAAAGGTADALTATYSPVITALVNGTKFLVEAASANATTTPTMNVNGIGAKTIVKGANSALAVGDIGGSGHWLELTYDSSLDKFVLSNPVKGISTTTVFAADLQAMTYQTFTTGGTSTAFTLTPSPALSALATNQEFSVLFHTAAGTTPTLAISGLTAKNLKYYDSTGAKQAVTSTQIPSGWPSRVTYDGTDYVVRDIPVGGTVAALSTASGSAPSYSARAWVNFNGTGTVAIRASGNVSSITDNGTGDYTVNFTTAMPDANYSGIATCRRSTAYKLYNNATLLPTSASAAQVCTGVEDTYGGELLTDSEWVSVAIFR